jgi:NAD(P)-dependent dehydrogenase (short-subunit alcohol dehydrogenase family)
MMTGKRVVITAGASGIGLTMAETFLAHGAIVCICDIDGKAVNVLANTCDKIYGVEADVADPEAMKSFFAFVDQKMGGLDILINNAGISGPTAPLEDIDIEDWQQTIDVDLNAQFYCAKFGIPMLKAAGGGSIIIMSSNAAFFGCANRAPYTASKWALIGLMKTLAIELGPDQIRVNALCPCSVDGARIEGVIKRDAEARGLDVDTVRSSYQRQSSLRSFVKAEDVAAMALFLSSEMGVKISGQAIGIDGHTETLAQF